MIISKDDVTVHDGWINVKGIGNIGLYFKYEKEIHLDYSMNMIVGTNKSIPCEESEIKDKVIELFKNA